MLMTNGLGASIGTWVAGKVFNSLVFEPQRAAMEAHLSPAEVAQAGNWSEAWYIFAAYAFVVGVLFALLFKDPQKQQA